MADIFVSYARADKARVAPLVEALEAQGWTVWWDPEINPGQEFDRQISAELDAAKAVIVAWTPLSVESRWVRGEAREAADRGVLVPVRFGNARLPIDVRAVHTIDLDGWGGAADSQEYRDLCRALKPLVAGSLAREQTDVRARPPGAVSICVLPFANMSGDPEQEYFADGITEDIITDLSKVGALTVISRNSAFTFKGKHVDLPQVARQLRVTHLLEGSVRKSGMRLRITAQLIDGATNGHVWAERYDRNLEDIFALQDEISEAIVAALKLKLLPKESEALEDRGTDNVEAYDLYLRARSLARTLGPHPLKRALELYREALALDPQFALAWASLASSIYVGTVFLPEAGAASQAAWDQAVERAVATAPDLWAGQIALGQREVYQRHWVAAEAAFNHAVQRAPRSSAEGGWDLGGLLMCLGRIEEAIIRLRANCAADPLSNITSSHLQVGLTLGGRDEEAEKEYRRSRDLVGDRTPIEHLALLRAWARQDSPESIREHMREFIRHDSVAMPAQSELLELIDRPAAARARLGRAFEDPSCQDATRQFRISLWAAQFDDTDLALAAARRAYIELHSLVVYLLWLPVYGKMRRDVRFKELLRDLRIVDYWRQTDHWGDFARPVGNDDFEITK